FRCKGDGSEVGIAQTMITFVGFCKPGKTIMVPIKSSPIDDDSSNRSPMSTDPFRGCMYHDIGTPLNRLKHIRAKRTVDDRSEEHTSELQSRFDLVCRLLLEKKRTRPQARDD